MPAAKHLTAVRLSLFYAAFFVVIGILVPFWPVWLASRGLGTAEIGVLVAVGISVKVIGNPLMAHIADRHGRRRRLIVLLAAGALAAFALFRMAEGFWAILGVTVAFHFFWSAIMPLGENLTLLTTRAEGLDYGRLRLWGSISFIAAAVLVGRTLVEAPEDLVFWLALAAIAATLAVCTLLPDTRPPPAEVPRFPVLEVLADRTFLAFLAAATLVQGSHAVYYAFGTLHWRSAGYADDVIGWLWAEGVIAEIVLFAAGAGLARRLGPARLIALGGLGAAVRWTATGLSDDLPVLVTVQALHAFTFGAAHLGAMMYIARNVPPSMSATAQSLYSAVVMGLGIGLATTVSGPLYGAFGGGAYLAMAASGAAGGILAFGLARRALP